MCLLEVGLLHRGLFGLDIDLEPSPGSAQVFRGRLVSVVTIPACPGFRHLTFRRPDGTGQEFVAPNSLLVYVYCQSRSTIFPKPATTTEEPSPTIQKDENQ